MKIKMLRQCVVNKESQKVGNVVEASDKDAAYLIGTAAAVEYVEKEKAPKKSKAESEKPEQEKV